EYAGRRDRIDVGIEVPLALGGGDADGPVAGATDVRGAAALEALHRADLVTLVVVLPVGRLGQFLGVVVESCLLEVALLLGPPFLQPEVRFDDEFLLGHVKTPVVGSCLGWLSSSPTAAPDARRRGVHGSS